jgi:hypothetical protein
MDIPNTESLAAIESSANLIRTTIISVEPLRIKGGISASCAVSCLVKPRIGDQVLCATSVDGQAYLLAILERLEPVKETLIYSEAPVQVQACQLTLVSEQIDLISERVNCNIGTLKRVMQTVEDVVGNCQASFGTFLMFAKRSMRRVEELDETRAGHLKLESPALVEVSGAVTAISGDELISMQSKQIHMG